MYIAPSIAGKVFKRGQAQYNLCLFAFLEGMYHDYEIKVGQILAIVSMNKHPPNFAQYW